jgi:hypothetical protein
MKRFFAFGCSYTFYCWPTWADFLGLSFDHYENWGLPGLGNRAILERITECNIKNKFNEDDLVIVQWSGHLRNDFFNRHSLNDRSLAWKTSGSIFNDTNEKLYDKKWLSIFFDECAYLMHTLNFISTAQHLLENTKCKWFMTGAGDIRKLGSDIVASDLYKENISHSTAWIKYPEMKIYERPIWDEHSTHWINPISDVINRSNLDFFKFKNEIDYHPTPNHHLLWIKENLIDKLPDVSYPQDHYDYIVNSVDNLYEVCKSLNSEVFYNNLQKENFLCLNDIQWPTKFRGFYE